MTANRKNWICGLAAMVLACALGARGEDGITVAGVGTEKAKPTVVEIGATVTGEAELTADAMVKYRDAKRRSIEKLEGLKIAALTIQSSGFAVNAAMDANQQMRMMQGMGGGENVKQKVQVTEQIKLVIKDVDKLDLDGMMQTILKVIDTGKDAGLVIGPPPATNYYQMQIQAQTGASLMSFKLPSASALREKAYKTAVEDARQKAAKLAELSGLKLGKILSVTEGGAPSSNSNDRVQMLMMMNGMSGVTGNPDENELSNTIFSDVSLSVRLVVHFEIQK
ncbi:MAG: SIMPL domain-containing protein [Tepidisphaerales bacterium]